MTKFESFITEKKESYPLYHDSYTSAIDAGIEYAKKQKFETDAEELAKIVGMDSKRPKSGQTTKVHIPLYKDGKKQRKMLHISVYNRETKSKPFELTAYVS